MQSEFLRFNRRSKENREIYFDSNFRSKSGDALNQSIESNNNDQLNESSASNEEQSTVERDSFKMLNIDNLNEDARNICQRIWNVIEREVNENDENALNERLEQIQVIERITNGFR